MATVSELGTPTWSTHLPLLLAAILKSEGPVLEIGVGHFSTPILHSVCNALGRTLVSVESDRIWATQFMEQYGGGFHDFEFGFDCLERLSKQQWGAVLVDESPGSRRGETVKLFGDCADFLVVHDVQAADVAKALKDVKNDFTHWTDARYEVHAMILSKRKELPSVL